MRWLVADSLYCPEAFFCSHLDSYSHYLREAGEDVWRWAHGHQQFSDVADYDEDVLFALDRYGDYGGAETRVRIAQVAAICNPMPWEVPGYDCIISSIPWMVEEARAKGYKAEYMPLAFDTRSRVCGMGVKRDVDCLHVGTVGPNHGRRAEVLSTLGDAVTVAPPTFGRAYFSLLARAKVVLNIHAEWARGAANNMRMFEAVGMGCGVIFNGLWPEEFDPPFGVELRSGAAEQKLDDALKGGRMGIDNALVLQHHTYESRIPRLIEIAKECLDA